MSFGADGAMRIKAICLALGVLPDGMRDILGLWIVNSEGAKFWLKVFNDFMTPGMAGILIAVTDGLGGVPEALSIYTVPGAESAAAERDALEAGPWGQKFPTVVVTWRRAWERVIPFLALRPAGGA